MNKILLSIAAVLVICFTACAQKKDKQNVSNASSKMLVAYFSATGTDCPSRPQHCGHYRRRTVRNCTSASIY